MEDTGEQPQAVDRIDLDLPRTTTDSTQIPQHSDQDQPQQGTVEESASEDVTEATLQPEAQAQDEVSSQSTFSRLLCLELHLIPRADLDSLIEWQFDRMPMR
jgi:hypothetical protein